MLQLLIEPLHSLRQEGNDFDWRTAEAALYCIKYLICRSLHHPERSCKDLYFRRWVFLSHF